MSAENSPPSTPPSRGYSATKDELRKRLARIEGQVRGVQRMVEKDRYCIDVVTQLSAIQAALDKVALGLLDDHARHCMQGKGTVDADPAEQVNELMGAVGRLLHR
jgi:DNA-binding FrmR family transcriptional regulator